MTKPATRKAATRAAIDHKTTNRDVPSPKLTDVQRIVLSDAVLRNDGAAALPEGMTEKAVQKLAATLVAKRLVREVRAKGDMPIWRRNEEGRACALIVTKLGREAIKGDEGRQPIGVDVDASALSSIPDERPSQTALPSQSAQCVPRKGSKLAEVMTLLGRKDGVAIEELTSRTGWLPHTTRAALTGLRKRGYAIERSRSEQGGTVYRIVTGAAPAQAA
jgi:Protein of unknown function (DUF3489)